MCVRLPYIACQRTCVKYQRIPGWVKRNYQARSGGRQPPGMKGDCLLIVNFQGIFLPHGELLIRFKGFLGWGTASTTGWDEMDASWMSRGGGKGEKEEGNIERKEGKSLTK